MPNYDLPPSGLFMQNGIIPYNGIFTIQSHKVGQPHRTFQIKTLKGGTLIGRRILALFVGKDNNDQRSYIPFAFIEKDRIYIWNKFKRSNNHNVYAAMLKSMVIGGEHSQFYKMGYRLHISKRCRVCNRLLTNPQSISDGIGPECASRQ